MSDLGLLLRKARTQKNISLEDLQETTKIRKRYLEAIEEGNFKVLPGNFYVRAFIKQYSEAVGLDPDEVLRLYQNELPSVEPEPSTEPIRMKRRSAVNPPERIGKWASGALMIAFPVLIIGVIYYFFLHNAEPRQNMLEDVSLTDQRASEQEGQSGIQPNEGQDSIADPAPQPDPEPEPEPEPEPDVAFVETYRAGSAQADRYEVKNAMALQIDMRVTGTACWVGLKQEDHNGKTLYEKGLTADEIYTGQFDHSVYINVGRANEIELKVNGVLIDMGTEPNPRKFQFVLSEA